MQVLSELANVARRKMSLSWPETHVFLSMVRALLPVQPITVDSMRPVSRSRSGMVFRSTTR